MMQIFYIDWQQHWKYNRTMNIGANAHGKRAVSTKQPQVTDLRPPLTVGLPVTSERYWASFTSPYTVSQCDCFTVRPFFAARYVHVFFVWNFTRLITRLERFFFNSIWWGALSSNVFPICAVYWSLGRRGYFGVSNVVLVWAATKQLYEWFSPSVCPSVCHTFLPEASFGLRVLSLPASVCMCVCQSVCQSLACPRDNSGPVQARITKFGPKVQNNLVKVPIVLWNDRPWPSRPNLRSKSKFTPFWACPHRNSSSIQLKITKFGPEVQNPLVKISIVLGGNWPWPSRSNLT